MGKAHYRRQSQTHQDDSAASETVMAQFSNQFYPDLVATLIGVFVAIPLGLAADRRIVARKNRSRLKELAETLDISLQANRQALSSIRDGLPTATLPVFDASIEATEWEMLKDDVKDVVPDILLRLQLAHLYSALRRVERLIALRLEDASDPPRWPSINADIQLVCDSAIRRIDEVRPSLRRYLAADDRPNGAPT